MNKVKFSSLYGQMNCGIQRKYYDIATNDYINLIEIICNYDGNKFELKIDKWTDYEGEQIQVKSNGKTYLLSANKCYMIGE